MNERFNPLRDFNTAPPGGLTLTVFALRLRRVGFALCKKKNEENKGNENDCCLE